MGYNLIKDITTVNKTVMSGKQNKYIVIHYTGNSTDTAKANANYFKTTNRGSSAHYFVDKTTVYQVVEDKDSAWAVGKNYGSNNLFSTVKNNNSISIEMCSDGGSIANDTFENTITLTKELMKKYGISASNVYRHYDVCSKSCPGWNGWLGSNPTLWNQFKSRLTINTTTTTIATGLGTVQLYDNNGSNAQKWQSIENADNTYSFKNVATGLYLDVNGASTKSGTKIQVYTGNGSNAQKFKIVDFGSGQASNIKRIVPVINQGMSMDISGASKSNGAAIQIYNTNVSGAQTWKMTDCGNGIYIFVNPNSNKVLDVAGGTACGRNDNYSKPTSNTNTTTTTTVNNTTNNNTNVSKYNSHLKDLQGAITADKIASLVSDGLYGSKTDAALQKCVVKNGSRGNVVSWVQCRIGCTADGIAGNQTVTAIKAYQKSKGLSQDGCAGYNTIKQILRDYGCSC